MHKQIHTDFSPKAIGPYSQAVETGGMVFCSGQLGINPQTGEILAKNIADETKQVLTNLGEVLKAAGLNFSDVVRCDIFLTDLKDFAQVNEVYASFFTTDVKPARQTVEVSNLPKGAKVEISCIAVRN